MRITACPFVIAFSETLKMTLKCYTSILRKFRAGKMDFFFFLLHIVTEVNWTLVSTYFVKCCPKE